MERELRVMRKALAVGALAALGITLGEARRVAAVPLEIEACDKLVKEEAELERAGARVNLAKGPQWAKANLSQDKIEQIRRLIEVDEQVAFRCLRTKPLPAESLVAQPVPQPGTANATAAPVAKPKPRPKPAVAQTDGGTGAAPSAPQAAPAPKPKPVVKAPVPKPADAYAPAPAARTGN